MFPNDDTAKDWFVLARWPAGRIACPHCRSLNVQIGCAHKSMDYRCRNRDCAKRFSVRSGTVMQSSKLGYQVWAIATYLVVTNLKGISSMKLHRELKITQKAAWHLAHRLRKAMTSGDRALFAGPVVADETYIGGLKKNMHSRRRKLLAGGDNKFGIAGVLDRATNKIRTMVMRPDGPSLKEFVLASMKRDATVYTDDSKAYRGLPQHETVQHSAGEYVRGDVSTNSVESYWAMIARGIFGVFHKLSFEHGHRYAIEFECRHNMRDLDTIDQMSLVVQGMESRQLRYRDLIAAGVRANLIANGWTPPVPGGSRRERHWKPPAGWIIDTTARPGDPATTEPETR